MPPNVISLTGGPQSRPVHRRTSPQVTKVPGTDPAHPEHWIRSDGY
jgi:hypothetical protein